MFVVCNEFEISHQGTSQDLKNKAFIVGTALLNLSEYVSSGQVKEMDISLPLTVGDGLKGSKPLLMVKTF